jgi:hypothetical protein
MPVFVEHAPDGQRKSANRASLAGLSEAECDGNATGGGGSSAVTDDEPLSDVVAAFERASRRSRTIAGQYDLDRIVQHPRAGVVISGANTSSV